MAKLQDKLMNRVIEGDLELDSHENAQVASVAKSAIQADKDVLSQIEFTYDEDNNKSTITLPRYVLPIRMYFENVRGGDNIYFDYTQYELRDDDNSLVGTISIRNEQVSLFIEGDVEKSESDDMTFCYFNSVEVDLNTYYLYHQFLPEYDCRYLYFINHLVFEDTINNSYSISSVNILSNYEGSPNNFNIKSLLEGNVNSGMFTVTVKSDVNGIGMSYLWVDNNDIKVGNEIMRYITEYNICRLDLITGTIVSFEL